MNRASLEKLREELEVRAENDNRWIGVEDVIELVSAILDNPILVEGSDNFAEIAASDGKIQVNAKAIAAALNTIEPDAKL